jgi:hypothetical protein
MSSTARPRRRKAQSTSSGQGDDDGSGSDGDATEYVGGARHSITTNPRFLVTAHAGHTTYSVDNCTDSTSVVYNLGYGHAAPGSSHRIVGMFMGGSLKRRLRSSTVYRAGPYLAINLCPARRDAPGCAQPVRGNHRRREGRGTGRRAGPRPRNTQDRQRRGRDGLGPKTTASPFVPQVCALPQGGLGCVVCCWCMANHLVRISQDSRPHGGRCARAAKGPRPDDGRQGLPHRPRRQGMVMHARMDYSAFTPS